MSISAIGNGTMPAGYSSPASGAAKRQTTPGASQSRDVASALPTGGVEQQFLDYMKKSPAERMVDSWLEAHGLTREDLEKMPPEKREAILKQMAQDIKTQVEQKIEAQQKGKTDILV